MRIGSLFSGIGGIDLGFIQNGHRIAWANELDVAAVKTYKHNFPEIMLHDCDVRCLDTGLLEPVDCIVAGFPCQPFSIMGHKRGFKDSRGNLFFEIARIAGALKPRFIFLENVANLVYHDKGRTFLVIYNTLAALGYIVKYRVINATDVNVPQNRARIFIVGFREVDDVDMFDFPAPVKLTETIDDVLDRKIEHSSVYYYRPDSKYYTLLNNRIQNKYGIYRIDDSGVAKKQYKICPTLKANMGTYPDRVPIIRDDFGIRKITPRECLDFQGYPVDFNFSGIALNDAYKQVGNSVCVPVIKNIAEKFSVYGY